MSDSVIVIQYSDEIANLALELIAIGGIVFLDELASQPSIKAAKQFLLEVKYLFNCADAQCSWEGAEFAPTDVRV
jgi:hypothetical protein